MPCYAVWRLCHRGCGKPCNLQTLVGQLEARLVQSRGYYLEAGRAALAVLASDRLTLNLQISLAIQLLNVDELAEFFNQLIAKGELHAEGLVTATSGISQLARRIELAELERLELLLANGQDERLRRLAVAVLVAETQPPNGWDGARLSRLQVYQTDTSILVASAAQFTFPPLQ